MIGPPQRKTGPKGETSGESRKMFFSWRQKTSSFEYRISKVQNHYRACPQDNKNNKMSL